ncbi:MAG TPA: MscL family protein [Bacillota bacterium]|nr:MscL family protein [Bacillota bacterium]
MATKQSKQKPTQPVVTEAEAEENKRREIREVATKLRHLGPVSQAEVVGQVLGRQASKQVGKQLGGFTDFLREQSVIGIGIGLVLGTQLKTVVDSLTLGLVLPITQLFLPGKQKFTDLSWTVHLGPRSTDIKWGSVVYTLFNFVLVALIVYAVFKFLKLDRLAKKKD